MKHVVTTKALAGRSNMTLHDWCLSNLYKSDVERLWGMECRTDQDKELAKAVNTIMQETSMQLKARVLKNYNEQEQTAYDVSQDIKDLKDPHRNLGDD